MDLGSSAKNLLDGQQVSNHPLIRIGSQRCVVGQGHGVGRRRAVGHGTRDDDQVPDAGGRSGDHHGLDLPDRPFTSVPGSHLEVGRQIRTGRHMDKRLDVA
jgi:hypothetical protein